LGDLLAVCFVRGILSDTIPESPFVLGLTGARKQGDG
jgi:hypothetical protein